TRAAKGEKCDGSGTSAAPTGSTPVKRSGSRGSGSTMPHAVLPEEHLPGEGSEEMLGETARHARNREGMRARGAPEVGKPRRKLKLRGRGVRAETAQHLRGRHHTGMIPLSGRIGQDEIAPVGCGLRGKASVPHKRAT